MGELKHQVQQRNTAMKKHPDDALGGWPALVVSGFAVSLVLIDGFMISIATPHLLEAFQMKPEHMGWIIGAYVLPLAALPLIFGALGDRYGVRRLFSCGVVLLVAGALLCATADTMYQLILWRFLQGCGAALISPQTLNAAATALGASRRGLAIGVWGALSAAAMLLGPIIGGLVLSYLDWRWIFLVNLPLGLLALSGFLVAVPKRPVPTVATGRPALPIASALMLATGAGLIVAALGPGFRGEPIGAAGLAAGVAILAFWYRRERRDQSVAAFLVGPDILANRSIARACLAVFAMNASSAGTVAVISLAVMQAQGAANAALTSWIFVPGMVMVAALMPYAGSLAQRRTNLSRFGLIAAVMTAIITPALTGAALFALPQPSFAIAAAAIALQGTGAAFVLSYATFGAIISVAPKDAGLASGSLSMSRNIGTAVGAATLTGSIAVTGSLHLAFVASLCLATLALPFLRQYLQRTAAAASSVSVQTNAGLDTDRARS
ncbi:MAG: MFS transporter [Parvibaculum sp.]|nr:MFS transporter [Parvibaculum sp.]